MTKESPISQPNTPPDETTNPQQDTSPFRTKQPYRFTTLKEAFKKTNWFGNLDTHDTSTSKPDTTESPSASNQDKIYDNLKLEYIDLPPMGTSFPNTPEHFSRETMQAHLFTTENLANYMPSLNLKGKKVVGIGGSGDFGINALMYGAESFTAVEIAPFAGDVAELKTVAVPEFNYDEFINFFDNNPSNVKFLSYEQYLRLRPKISKHAKHIFDQAITRDGNLFPKGMLSTEDITLKKKMNPYLESPENYEKAQRNIKEKPVPFYLQDIREFLSERNSSDYDHVYLSNIVTYPPYSNAVGEDIVLSETTRLIQSASNALTEGGEISSHTLTTSYYLESIKDDQRNITRDFNKNTVGTKMKGQLISGSCPLTSDIATEYVVLKLTKQLAPPIP